MSRNDRGSVPPSYAPQLRSAHGLRSEASSPRRYDPAALRQAYDLPVSIAPTPQYPSAPPRTASSDSPSPEPGEPLPLPDSPGRTPGPGTARRRRKRHPARFIFTILTLLIVAVLVFAWTQINWINSGLNHENMLTTKADTPAKTWLLIGSDERDGSVGGTKDEVPGFRTDTLLVLTKPQNGNSSLISIPRDSYVTIDGTDMKINAVAETYGYQRLVSTVEDITGMKIDHVVRVGFSGVKDIVDAIGGVDLCLDYDVNDAYSGLTWTAGCHTADGTTALAFARMRYSDPKGDIGRAERQRQVISAIMKKLTTDKSVRNYSTIHSVGDTGMGALTVDEDADAFTMAQLALAFRDATGSDGVTGSVYFSNIDYRPSSGIGSCVLLDDEKNLELFQTLQEGTQEPGTVGGYTS